MTRDDDLKMHLLQSLNFGEWAVRVEDRLMTKSLDQFIRECVIKDTQEKIRNDRKASSLIRSSVSMQLLPYLGVLGQYVTPGPRLRQSKRTVFKPTS